VLRAHAHAERRLSRRREFHGRAGRGPIRPGERINARATVLETRPSRSRPDIGFVKFRFELINAADQAVMTLIVSPMFGRRAADAGRNQEPNAASRS
jgi:hypothetical protein